ncbi:MAG: HAMP domain-containing histidine kinase, partial [Vallitaleaceae bacterium]|nr:HAMP domain-containing histidine kinase [Vallitaleaceae bacterium]
FVVKNHDELYELNAAINGMYEELKANIYQLESELSKERNTELLKKRFLAQATHELKTPIAVIGGYAELLVEKMYQSEEEEAHYHKSIYEESQRMNRLIMDVLDYTKMETGNFQIQKKEQDLHKWAKNLEQKWMSLAEQAHKHLEVQIPKESLQKEFDEFRMEQVVTNLLTNALEHAKSKVIINFRFYDSKVVIQVSNDGKPIEDGDVPYLFDSFYKAKGKKSGTGLGLAIVKAIIGLHQGEYRVENHQDGVTFSVSF